MTPERWQQIKAIVSNALERELGRRAQFLAQACGGDAALRAEVDSLLAHEQPAEDFIEQPAFELPTTLTTQGGGRPEAAQRIGPYKLLRELGRGGMGAVWLAARDDEFRKQVAIKLIKRGMDSDFILRRFRTERQILASLDHPHIARLLDGGTTEDGSPYLVMEYAEGQPLGDYCDSRRLTTPERLRLFRDVCAAVHYAHQHLVVHRDLKPSNILVTQDGVTKDGTVKLLDFGIAKLLTPELSAETLDPTAPELRLMTPEYASPEQVRGLPITTASDVYSLGVVLYELLTGHRPYRLKSRAPHEVMRAVCDSEPERPSTAVTREETISTGENAVTLTPEAVSRTRDGQPATLRRRLKGDIDNIVLMALRKEPQRRYASVEQFSEDIRRHLEGLPVIARRSTFGYRASKFVRRNRLAVGAAAVVLVTLVVGIVLTAQARARAERRFNEVRQLAKAVVFDYNDAIEKLPGSTPVRQRIVSDALKYLDGLSREAGGDRALKLELAEAYQRIGNIQGNGNVSNLGDTEGALTSYRKALALQESLAADGRKNTDVRRHLAKTYTLIGDVLWDMGKLNETLESYKRALPLREADVADHPNGVEEKRELAKLLLSLGDLSGNDGMANLGDTAAGAAYHRRSLAIREALAAAQPQNADLRRDLFDGLLRMGDIQRAAGESSAAVETYRQGLAMIEELSAADPHDIYKRTEIANTAIRLGRLLNERERAAEALEAIEKAVAVMESLAAAESANAAFKRNLSVTYNHAAISLLKLNRPAEALKRTRQAMAIIESLAAADGSNKSFRADFAITRRRMGDAYALLNDTTTALNLYRQALTLQEEAQAEAPSANLREGIAISRWRIAGLLARTGDLSGALNFYGQALANYDALFASGLRNVVMRRDYAATQAKAAAVYAQLNRWPEAREAYQLSLDIYTELRGQGALPEADTGKPDELAREIAKCDAALAKVR
jgi:eukaryotic-like serine/threonine-protein kinase